MTGRNLPASCGHVVPQAQASSPQHQDAQKGHVAAEGGACQRQTQKRHWMSGSELVVLGDDSFTGLLYDQTNALIVGRQLEVTRSTFTYKATF